MSVKSEMGFYTPEEFERFLAAAANEACKNEEKNNCLSEWNYFVFFAVAYFTGLRLGEVLALKWSDISGAYLSVRRSLSPANEETPPKNRSSVRTLQMPEPLIVILGEHRERQRRLMGDADMRVCGGPNYVYRVNILKRNKRYAEMAGVKRIRVHDFRHSHASLLANEGINIQEIARRLGHSRIEMTWNTYSHLYPREEERAVAVLNKVACPVHDSYTFIHEKGKNRVRTKVAKKK
jgi:integrase